MNQLIQSELKAILTDWIAGRTVRSIVLGHPVKVNKKGEEERHVFSQHLAHEAAFQLIASMLDKDVVPPFEVFTFAGQEVARYLKLSDEERESAISLAWVALHRGWKGALLGHAEHQSIALNRETEA